MVLTTAFHENRFYNSGNLQIQRVHQSLNFKGFLKHFVMFTNADKAEFLFFSNKIYVAEHENSIQNATLLLFLAFQDAPSS